MTLSYPVAGNSLRGGGESARLGSSVRSFVMPILQVRRIVAPVAPSSVKTAPQGRLVVSRGLITAFLANRNNDS